MDNIIVSHLFCTLIILSVIQGSKFSDFSLISDFFPTLRTILEISVNLKRKIF